MPTVRIYQPPKSAMQSGTANTHGWVLEPEAVSPPTIDPLMGWTTSANTDTQISLTFATKEEAIAYAERMGFAYTVTEPKPRKQIRKSYADNFRFGRIGSWTH